MADTPCEKPEPNLWTRSFIFIFTSNLLVFISFYCLLPTLPLFITEYLAGDTNNVGFIFGIFALAAVLTRPLAGYFLDTVGRRVVLLASLLFLTLVMGAYVWVASLTLLFVNRALHGLAWGFATTASGTVATDIIPACRRGEGIGYYGLSSTVAMAIGPWLGLEILRYASYDVLFLVSFGLAAIGLLCGFGVSDYVTVSSKKKAKFSSSQLLESRIFWYSAITMCIAILYSGMISFIVLYGKQLGVGNPGNFFLVYAVSLVISRPYAGRFLDVNGPMKIVAFGYAALAISFLLLFAAHDSVGFLTAAFFMGAGIGTVWSCTLTMAINRVETFRRGVANGTILTAFDLGVGLGSITLGWVTTQVGLSYMYLVSGVFTLVPLFLFYWTDAKEHRSHSE